MDRTCTFIVKAGLGGASLIRTWPAHLVSTEMSSWVLPAGTDPRPALRHHLLMRPAVRVSDTTFRLPVIGVLGSVLMAAASFGAGATLTADTDETRFAEQFADPGYAIGLVCWLVGGGLLTTAWWRLGRVIQDGGMGGSRLRWIGIAWAVPFLFSAPTGSRDVYAYALQGLLYTHGLDPYAVGPAALDSPWLPAMSQFWQNSPTPYGPLAVLLSGAAAALSGGQLVVALIWLRLSALLGVILTAVYLPRLARTCGADPIAAGWLGAASPLVFVHLLSTAHHDALTLGLLIAGLHLATRHRGWQSGIALGFGRRGQGHRHHRRAVRGPADRSGVDRAVAGKSRRGDRDSTGRRHLPRVERGRRPRAGMAAGRTRATFGDSLDVGPNGVRPRPRRHGRHGWDPARAGDHRAGGANRRLVRAAADRLLCCGGRSAGPRTRVRSSRPPVTHWRRLCCCRLWSTRGISSRRSRCWLPSPTCTVSAWPSLPSSGSEYSLFLLTGSTWPT